MGGFPLLTHTDPNAPWPSLSKSTIVDFGGSLHFSLIFGVSLKPTVVQLMHSILSRQRVISFFFFVSRSEESPEEESIARLVDIFLWVRVESELGLNASQMIRIISGSFEPNRYPRSSSQSSCRLSESTSLPFHDTVSRWRFITSHLYRSGLYITEDGFRVGVRWQLNSRTAADRETVVIAPASTAIQLCKERCFIAHIPLVQSLGVWKSEHMFKWARLSSWNVIIPPVQYNVSHKGRPKISRIRLSSIA